MPVQGAARLAVDSARHSAVDRADRLAIARLIHVQPGSPGGSRWLRVCDAAAAGRAGHLLGGRHGVRIQDLRRADNAVRAVELHLRLGHERSRLDPVGMALPLASKTWIWRSDMRAFWFSALLFVTGCQLGERTRGEFDRVSFSYITGDCFFGCGLQRPIL